MSSPNRRRDLDLTKLMMSNYEVTMSPDSMAEFTVTFNGPKDSPYFGGTWKVRVELPPNYPYKSPSIGFLNKIYHPNVDLASGSVCLDVINQTWSPMFDLINIFEVFLPQLLLYPNPTDPLNGEAASMLLKEPEKFKLKVKEFVNKYATKNAEQEDSESESDLSSYTDDSDVNLDDSDKDDDGDSKTKFSIDL
ncbi:hypothetical protein SAMD00019534_029030 [Acytostelium subglobosum LB1]|uniref:hypothetical protein n=1 Tax=Acytostelium subglobosum LB1 TaxID=1410327 RepID=UPI000644D461|nr:hypothetical protein SAMD00019534_029030 [Acytostelium subglobosum LB1]GAM19728.1 hypothetical protein SAMD00019534_029030 [Acytostelium subglobosum LB1]|eukprot:XP_012756490.1 hypothetical protein SAMD00019534_029030 [Acytostelium subglobosum LB1]